MRLTLAALMLSCVVAGLALAGDEEEERIVTGQEAPGFRLNDQHGKALSLAEHGKGAWTVLAFFPKASTPG